MTGRFWVTAAVLSVTAWAGAEGGYSPEMGGFRQLFADDYRIESLTQAGRKLHAGDKVSTPVLSPDRPWEKDATYLYGTVMYDAEEGIFKMWYQTFYMRPPKAYMLYAISKDGLTWEKPDLGLVEWEGSKQNNIVLEAEIGTVVKDERTTDPQRRYKMFGFVRPHYDVWFSPDGLKWTKTAKDYVIREGDVSNAGYDPYKKDFYVTVKLPHPAGRASFLSTSTDFENWTSATPVMVADNRDQARAHMEGAQKMDIYGFPMAPYEGAYIGFPWLFRVTGKGGKDTGGDGHIDVQFAFSRDRLNWTRPVREAIIPNGAPGSFDDEMILTSSGPVVRGDEMRLYYGGWDGPHGTFRRKARIGMARWQRDRFVSITNGGFTTGTIVTKPVRLDGNPLHVNASLAAGGRLVAELLDVNNMPMQGYTAAEANPVTGDSLDTVLTWNQATNFGPLAGRTVKIRFHLLGGDLFSFWQK